mgnify:CR=1 FL=1
MANLKAMGTLAKFKEPARYVPRYFSKSTLKLWRNLENLIDTIKRAIVINYSSLPKILRDKIYKM